jgi:streptogramin lyase
LIALNRIASLDPRSGKVEEYTLPQEKKYDAFYTQAYGVVFESDRRHLWITQLGANRLLRFDTETGKIVKNIRLKRGDGPRRLAIDSHDVLWVPLYGAGQILAYDTHNGRDLARYDLPDRNAAPYALSWDKKRNQIWVTGGNANSIYRFDITSKLFTVYPLPGNEAIMRSIPVDTETGAVWTSYATQENAHGASMMIQLIPGEPVK